MATHRQPAIRQLILVLAAVTIAGGGIVYGKINEVPGNDHLFVSSPPVNRPPNPANIPRLPDSHHTVGPDNDRVVGWAFTVDADAASGPPTSHTAPVPQSSPAPHTARAKRKVVLAGHEVFWGLGRRPRMLRSRGGLFLIFRRVAAILV